jgi:hypothetical protein
LIFFNPRKGRSIVKAPSKNIAASLRGQRNGGRQPETITITEQRRGPSMIVPGEGKVEAPPGPRDGAAPRTTLTLCGALEANPVAKGPKSTVIGGNAVTVKAVNSTFREMFTPNWDERPAMAQERQHVEPRRRMGKKMTPRGRGTLRPARR